MVFHTMEATVTITDAILDRQTADTMCYLSYILQAMSYRVSAIDNISDVQSELVSANIHSLSTKMSCMQGKTDGLFKAPNPQWKMMLTSTLIDSSYKYVKQ